jgi:hypothetical protein
MGRVLGAAVAAAADRDSAERATVRAFAEAGGSAWDADELAATAVCLALREAPAFPFCAMGAEDAEAIALARLLQLPETRIAALLDIDRRELRQRFARGLRACLPEPVCA